MSEEEREIDIELDGENDSVLGGQYDNKRALHNAMERKRRDSIKDSFRGLQDCIPTLRGDKTSRAQVLKKTGEYITHMQRKITDHQDEIKSLKSENTQLESQIRALEKAKATGNFVNARAILEADNLTAGEDIDLNGLRNGEIIYDDNSSDTSDSNNGAAAAGVAVSKAAAMSKGVVKSSNVVTVSLPKVTGVPMSLASDVTRIQPGQSLLASRVQPGQSLLISEPMRKKMKIAASNSLV